MLAKSRRARLGDALIAQSFSTEAFLSLRATETSECSPKLRVLIWCLGRERTEPTSPDATALRSHHRKIQFAVLVEVASTDLLGIGQRSERERNCKRAIPVAAKESHVKDAVDAGVYEP